MPQMISNLLDYLSEFIAHRKGLLPLLGIALVALNFILQLVGTGWLVQTNCFMHLGSLWQSWGSCSPGHYKSKKRLSKQGNCIR
jgi:hypothetical protein